MNKIWFNAPNGTFENDLNVCFNDGMVTIIYEKLPVPHLRYPVLTL